MIAIDPQGAYGTRIASTFSAEAAAVVTTELRGEIFAITHIQSSLPSLEHTEPLAAESAFIFGMQLADLGSVELFTEGRLARKEFFRAGTLSMVDVALRPSARIDGKLDAIFFYLPRRVLDTFALENEGGASYELSVPPGRSIADPVVHQLSLALLPALENPDHVSRLFFEHVGLAFNDYVASTYTRLARPMRAAVSPLAPWQVHRAKELIANDLKGNVSIAEVAAQCRLSRSHFIRAFKETMGMPPHRWLTLRRIEAAKTMMTTTDLPLATIAQATGFAHLGHLSRVFSRFVGCAPSAWRRHHAPSAAIGKVK